MARAARRAGRVHARAGEARSSAPAAAPPVAAAPPPPTEPPPAVAAPELLAAVATAAGLVDAYRSHGHLAAHLDPLGSEPIGDPELDTSRLHPLTPELASQIPAALLGLHVPAETLAEALPLLEETYCGTMAYEIEHISDHEERTVAALGDRVRPVPPTARAGRAPPPSRAAVDRRGVRAVPPPRVPRPEAVLDRRAGRVGADARRVDRARRSPGRARRRHRHGPPRPPQRARPHARPAVRGDPPRVRGRTGAGRRRRQPGGWHRRREVPPGRRGDERDGGWDDRHHARLEPQSPRGRGSRRRGLDARESDRPLCGDGTA